MGTKSHALFYISGFFRSLRLSEYFKNSTIFFAPLYLTDYHVIAKLGF